MKRIDPYLAAEALGFSEKDKNILIALADDLFTRSSRLRIGR